MKRTSTILMLIIVLISSASMSAEAQRRRDAQDNRNHQEENKNQNREHERDDRDNKDHGNYSYDKKWNYQGTNHHDNHYRDREVTHVYHQYSHRPVVVYHQVSKPRYIYFKDYDVYYDNQRSVYITYSGRSWTVSGAAPHAMRNVNVRRVRSYEIDYHDDDFPRYLERRRPACGKEYRGW
jgi:hypothetical protein